MHAATVVVSNIVFVVGNVFFAFVDLTGQPTFMLKYKIQKDKNVPVSGILACYKLHTLLATLLLYTLRFFSIPRCTCMLRVNVSTNFSE